MVNLFAWRATDPKDLKHAVNPIGDENDHFIENAVARSSMVVACWGEHGRLFNRASEIRAHYSRRLHALKVNQSGEPAHPLYLPATLRPVKLTKLTRQPKNC